MQEAVENLLAYDAWFHEQAAVGNGQTEWGEVLDGEDVRTLRIGLNLNDVARRSGHSLAALPGVY